MRFTLALLLLVALALTLGPLLTASPTALASGLSGKEIARLFEEYGDEETSEDRRDRILKRLRARAKRGTLRKAIKKALSSGKTRAAAFDVAVALECSGLFKEAKKWVNSEYEELAVRTVFLSHSKGAEKFLLARWDKAEPGSESYEIVDAGFQEYWVGKSSLEHFHDVIVNKKKPPSELRAESTKAIIQHQMVLTDEELEEVGRRWKRLLRIFVQRNRTFNEPGRDLLHEAAWNQPPEFDVDDEEEEEFEPGYPPGEEEMTDEEIYNAHPYRDRILLSPRGSYAIDRVNWKNFTIVAWVMILDGDNANVGVVMEKGNALVGGHFVDGWDGWEGPGNVEGQMARCSGSKQKWTKFVIKLQGGKITVTIDGTTLTEFTGQYGSIAKGLRLSAGSGHLLIGSVTMQGGR